MLLPELLSYGIMVVMEDSGKATGNACCYIKGTANHNDVIAPCVAVVWIGDQKSVEDDRNVLAAAGLCLHSIKAFPFVMLPCKQGAWGCRKSWEGAQRGELTSADHRDVPYHTASCSACEGGGKKEEGDVWNYSLRIPKQPLHTVKLSLTENG